MPTGKIPSKTLTIRRIVSILAIFYGFLFLFTQTGKLLQPLTAETEMAKLPFGLFDWGYVWADTLIIVPMLLIGGTLLPGKQFRLGALLIFGGMGINLYATVFFIVGLSAVDYFLGLPEKTFLLLTAFLGLVCMVYLAFALTHDGTK
ncbi:hypothetical protein JW935_29380 [candidate division KSB1 bacterium]|nr:hypothetical protein [candidate division KSB1 bacterium]